MPTRKVLLRTALLASSALCGQVMDNLRAVARPHRCLIAATVRSQVGDSLDLDAATRGEFPQDNRWDYLLSVPGIGQIVGLEPHSAKDSEIRVVIAKKQHAVEYLRDHFPPKHRVAKWVWVSQGSVGFSRMERARRLLDQHGIAFEGRVLKSFG